MSYPAIAYNFLIASPGDVQTERDVVRDVIHRWNINHSPRSGTVLMPFGWDTHSWPAFGDYPQDVINEQVVQHADLAVAVFGNRLGTPTKTHASGTVEEIEGLVKNGKTVMVYWNPKTLASAPEDRQKYDELCTYLEELKNRRGIVMLVKSADDLKEQFSNQLQLLMNSGAYPGWRVEDILQLTEENNPLSDDAIVMLRAMKADEKGEIICSSEHNLIYNSQYTFANSNARDFARWNHAFKELEEHNLLEWKTGVLHMLTYSGFQFEVDDDTETQP